MADRIWQKVFKKQEDIVSRNISGETILVPVRGKLADMQRIFAIDPTAEYIWRQIDGENTLSMICGKMVNIFDADQAQVREDMLRFINELENNTLISEVA